MRTIPKLPTSPLKLNFCFFAVPWHALLRRHGHTWSSIQLILRSTEGLFLLQGTLESSPISCEIWSYRDHVAAVCNAAETVAKRSMENAAKETKEFYEPEDDGIYNIAV